MVLMFAFLIASSPSGWSEATESPADVAKNRLASVEERIKAIDQLKTSNDAEMISVLSQIIRDREEPITLRAHVMEVLAQSDDQWAGLELKKILKDTRVPSENRVLALYALWKKDARASRSELIELAQSSSESQEIRVAALNYLRTETGNWPNRFWENLYLRNQNPPSVRIQAMNGMKELGLLTQSETILIPIIENSSEPTELRKASILTAVTLISSDALEQSFLSILSKPENPPEMKRFALDNLALKPHETILPRLKEILSHERDPVLIEELKALIKNITPNN